MKKGREGIRPGAGKKADEFAELDAEDKAIAEYEEKKAQAGIPPGADHPGLGDVSRKDAAIKVSEGKAEADRIMSGLEDEQQQAGAASLAADEDAAAAEADAAEAAADEEEDEEEGREPIPPHDIDWFRRNFRLIDVSGLKEPHEVGIRHEVTGGRGVIPRDPTGNKLIKSMFWRIYELKPGYLEGGRSELDRRKAICDYIRQKAGERDGQGHLQTEEEVDRGEEPQPWHVVRLLTSDEVKDYDLAKKLRAIMSEDYEFSEPCLALRDYLIFLAVFILFVYTGRGDDKYWIKQTMDDYITGNEYMPTYNFEAITNTGQLYAWLDNLFLPVMFPQSTASGQALSCERQQYMEDGTNYRVGNVRMRQVKVGFNVGSSSWNEDYTKDYSTCDIPAMFQDATDRCFAPWGYKETLASENQQYKKTWKSMKWHNSAENESPSLYNSPTRHRFPGSGYTKVLANNLEEASKDVASLYRKTWIDIQTRAVFIEFTVLNVPTTHVVSAVLMLEYGAEGDVLPSAHYSVSTLYKQYVILTTTLDMLLSDPATVEYAIMAFVVVVLATVLLLNPWGDDKPRMLGGMTRERRAARKARLKRKIKAAEEGGYTLPSHLQAHYTWQFVSFAAPMFAGLVAYTTAVTYYSFAFGKSGSDYMAPVLEMLVYVMVFFQIVQEFRLMRQAKLAGDSYVGYATDAYNLIQFMNLGFFAMAFICRLWAMMEMHSRVDRFHDAIEMPCVRGNLTDTVFPEGRLQLWDAVPMGCWGTEEVAPTFELDDEVSAWKAAGLEEEAVSDAEADLAEEEAEWKASMYSEDYRGGEKYVDYGECPGVKRDKRLSAFCCPSSPSGFVNLQMAMYYDKWVDQLTAFNALLLFLKFFRYVRMFKTLALFSETMKESTRRMVTITIIIGIIMTGFAMAFHLAFGFRDPAYRDFPEAVKTLFEIVLGNFDMSFIRVINPYLGPLFFYSFILIMIMVVLSMFVAIVDSAYSDTAEKMMHMEYTFIRDDMWHYCVTKRRAKVSREERRRLREAAEKRAYWLRALKSVGWTLLLPCRCVYECCVFCKLVKPNPDRWNLTEDEKDAREEAREEAAAAKVSAAGNPAIYPPLDSPQRLYEELGLSRDFLLEPSAGNLTPQDRVILHKAIKYIEKTAMPDTTGEDYDEPELVGVMRPDGLTENGSETKLIVRNTEGFRRKLAIVSGHDVVLVKDDIIHLYFQVFRHYPFYWFRRLFLSIEDFRDYMCDGDDEVYKDEIDGGEASDLLGDAEGAEAVAEGGGEELTEEEQAAIEEKKRKHEELMAAVAGLDADELAYLHKLELPKLSLIRELTQIEDQQRGMLAVIEDLNRRSRDVATGYVKLVERKDELRAAKRKEKELEEAGRVTTLLED